MNDFYFAKRAVILQQMAALDSMEHGSLKAEFRSSPLGGTSGPYYKHQVWKDGANVSQRIPPEQAPALKAAIDNRMRFEDLARSFVELTVERTRQERFPEPLKKKLSQPSSRRKPRSRT